jgi:hypothetical protein
VHKLRQLSLLKAQLLLSSIRCHAKRNYQYSGWAMRQSSRQRVLEEGETKPKRLETATASNLRLSQLILCLAGAALLRTWHQQRWHAGRLCHPGKEYSFAPTQSYAAESNSTLVIDDMLLCSLPYAVKWGDLLLLTGWRQERCLFLSGR